MRPSRFEALLPRVRAIPFLPALALIVLTLAAYAPTLRNQYIWDDDLYVTENQMLRTAAGLRRIWLEPGVTWQYYPLVHTTFWLEYRAWGLRPTGYHAVNALIHAANAVLVWRVLRRLPVPGGNETAWMAAGVFALHPVHVESVAWITERKNVLAGFFFLLSLLAYLRFADAHANHEGDVIERGGPAAAPPRRRRWPLYAASLLSFLCAMLSKTVSASMPAVAALLLWWKRGCLRWRDLAPLLPFLLIGVPLGALTAFLEKDRVGAQGPEWALSAAQRILIAGRAPWFYASKLVWPRRLTFIYPRWEPDPGQWWQWLFPAAVLAALLALWLARRRWGRGPLVAALVFGGVLFPALGFFDVYPFRYSFVADHFQYLASLGVITLVVSAAAAAALRWRLPRFAAISACAAVLLTLGVLTARQTLIYYDAQTLWRDTLAKNPRATIAHVNLGVLLERQGRRREAEASYRAALAVQPGSIRALNNLGNLLLGRGEEAEAAACFREAIRASPLDAEAHYNLGRLLAGRGDADRAIDHLRRSIAIKNDIPQSHAELARLLLARGQAEAAWAHHGRAVALADPRWPIRLTFADALTEQGRYADAIAEHARAATEAPDHPAPLVGGAWALLQSGDTGRSIALYQRALALRPDLPVTHNGLGIALAQAGRLEEAVQHFATAARLDPAYENAHANLDRARALLQQRRPATQPAPGSSEASPAGQRPGN